ASRGGGLRSGRRRSGTVPRPGRRVRPPASGGSGPRTQGCPAADGSCVTPDVENLVAAGELVDAARVLGRPFEVEGVVVEGDRRGKGLGFPTANLDVGSDQLLPPKGIYAGAALGHRAAISIGV